MKTTKIHKILTVEVRRFDENGLAIIKKKVMEDKTHTFSTAEETFEFISKEVFNNNEEWFQDFLVFSQKRNRIWTYKKWVRTNGIPIKHVNIYLELRVQNPTLGIREMFEDLP